MPRSNESNSLLITNLLEKPFSFDIDGILFYHKEAHYIAGHTPLVLWLKAYMLPEILNISIPNWILDQTPTDYKGFRDAIEKSNLEKKKVDAFLNQNKSKSDFQIDDKYVKDSKFINETSLKIQTNKDCNDLSHSTEL